MPYIKNTAQNGKGIFAERVFRSGELVLEGRVEKMLEHNHSHASQVAEDRFFLPDKIYRHLNHSCDPNCGIVVNDKGAHSLIARRTILEGEEITFDYAMENYIISHFPAPCNCGSDQCRSTIRGWKFLSEDKKKEYRDYCANYLLEMDSGKI